MKLWILFIIIFSSQSWAISPEVVSKNSDAVEALKAKNTSVSFQKILEALAMDPFNPILKLNLGYGFELSEDYGKAFNEYISAAKLTNDSEIKFHAYFNAAEVSAKAKNVDRALLYYQKALDIQPESEETKVNIELLVRQQQGGGGEGGEQDQKKDNKDQGQEKKDQQQGQGEKPDEKKEPPQKKKQPPQKKKQPREFKSQQLTKDDVRKILEELKNQEQRIRAKEYEKGRKEKANEKDW